MLNENAPTAFAPPEREEAQKIQCETKEVERLPLIRQLIDLVPDVFLILNPCRQIVYCNAKFLEALGVERVEDVSGMRPGEALHCVHANDEGGCGTSEHCVYCGAVNSILQSQENHDITACDECRIIAEGNTAFNFKVWATNLTLDGEDYTFFVARDISNEKRRTLLERTFFHDIMNTAGGIQGIVAILRDVQRDELDEFLALATTTANTLIEEIKAQRDLLAAETGELNLETTTCDTLSILHDIRDIYSNHEVGMGKEVVIASDSVNMPIQTDPRLLKRVVGNMTKNALEATELGHTVTLGAAETSDGVKLYVHNMEIMPESVKMQVFQRSFSTKGADRGIGTYSIKLLGENYLEGKVGFESEEGKGTTFHITLPKH